MKRISNVLLLCGVVALLLATANAQGLNKRKALPPAGEPAETAAPPPNRPQPPLVNPRLQVMVLDRFLPQIDLTPEQKGKIREMRAIHIRRLQTLMAIERAHTKAYDEALFDPTMDQKEIEKRVAQLSEVRDDLLKAQSKFVIELRQILTTEQFTKLRQLMEEERERRQKNTP
ncbi:MAG: hypothetical protein U0Y68_08780 [Blastocatellia bacterium]